MEYRIYKYELNIKSGEQIIKMFSGGKFLAIDIQESKIVMWFIVDIKGLQKEYRFYLVETGSKFDEMVLLREYLGTISLIATEIEPYVLHVFKGG